MKKSFLQVNHILHKKTHTVSRVSKDWFRSEANRLIIWASLLFISTLIASHVGINLLGFMKLSNISVSTEIFSIAINSLSSILGIILAFLIATFEMNKRYFNSNYAESLFGRDTLRGLIVLFFSTILFSVSGLFSLNYDNQIIASNYGILTTYLFIISLLSLLPKIRELISETTTKKEVTRLVDKYVAKAGAGYYKLDPSTAETLKEIAKKASNEGDETIILDMLDALIRHFDILAETIEDESEGSIIRGGQTRDLSSSFSEIFYVVGRKCLENKQLHIVNYSSKSILHVMNSFVNKKQLYYSLTETEEMYVKLVKLAIKDGNNDLISTMIYGLEDYIKNQLSLNTPPAEKLWDFEAFDKSNEGDDTRYDLSNHWSHISHTTFRLISDIVDETISSSNKDAMQTALRSIQNINSEIIGMDKLSEEHKGKAIRFNNWVLSESYRKAISSDLITNEDTFAIFQLDTYFNLPEVIKSYPTFSVWNLQTICNIYYLAARSRKVSPHDLNNLGTTGRRLKSIIRESETGRQAVIYLVYVLGRIKAQVEAEIETDIWSAEIYLACHQQASSIQRWDKKNNSDRVVTRKINAMIQEYTLLNVAKKTSNSDKINFWNDLFPESKTEK